MATGSTRLSGSNAASRVALQKPWGERGEGKDVWRGTERFGRREDDHPKSKAAVRDHLPSTCVPFTPGSRRHFQHRGFRTDRHRINMAFGVIAASHIALGGYARRMGRRGIARDGREEEVRRGGGWGRDWEGRRGLMGSWTGPRHHQGRRGSIRTADVTASTGIKGHCWAIDVPHGSLQERRGR